MDYYSVLGVLPTAEPFVIKAAYKALAMYYHPDRFPGDSEYANRKMSEINEAYSVLSDPSRRKHYDNSSKEASEHSRYSGQEDAFEDADLNRRWRVACTFVPEIDDIYMRLRRISRAAAHQFRVTVVETKSYSEAERIGSNILGEFIRRFFGRDDEVMDFAIWLLENDMRNVASELNEAVVVLGDSFPARKLIDTICKRHNIDRPTEVGSTNIFGNTIVEWSDGTWTVMGSRKKFTSFDAARAAAWAGHRI